MANEEHVERLKWSVDAWNLWRREHPETLPDFRNTTVLRGVNLQGASLSGANLSRADLTSTDLEGADLRGAGLSRANLDCVNFASVRFWETSFVRVDLSHVKGLETVFHQGPSVVDINKIVLPDDEYIRNHFLRGVGFTEAQINHLTPRPIKYSSLFISYTHQDEAVANRLHADLQKKDVPCWFAPHDLQPGNYFRERIDQAIHSQEKLLLLLSEHSVKSGWVRYEVELALARENRQQREILFPLRLDDAIFDCTANWALSLRSTRHIGNFTGWQDDAAYQEAFSTLLQHLKVSKPVR